MAEPVSPGAKWRYDYIDHYRLDEKIIEDFLTEKWGAYKFKVTIPRSVKMTHNWPNDQSDLTVAPYLRQAIGQRLKEHADRLFANEAEATVDLLDLEDGADGVF
ncbi:MAG: hypothetical protein Q9211_004939 [Gyalolechia sp. 1 TL-2023]